MNRSTDNNWICPICGTVNPKRFYYSCPLQADCPKCNQRLESNEGIKILSTEELKKKRPYLFKKEDTEEK